MSGSEKSGRGISNGAKFEIAADRPIGAALTLRGWTWKKCSGKVAVVASCRRAESSSAAARPG